MVDIEILCGVICRLYLFCFPGVLKNLGLPNMTMNERKTIDLEQGWEFMQKGITKLKNILEELPEPAFSSEDYMMLYTYPLHMIYFLSACVNICLLTYASM